MVKSQTPVNSRGESQIGACGSFFVNSRRVTDLTFLLCPFMCFHTWKDSVGNSTSSVHFGGYYPSYRRHHSCEVAIPVFPEGLYSKSAFSAGLPFSSAFWAAQYFLYLRRLSLTVSQSPEQKQLSTRAVICPHLSEHHRTGSRSNLPCVTGGSR